MSHTRNVVICCAGVGARLGLDVPKCLAPVLREPLIHWQLDLLREFENVICVVGYRAADVMRAVRDKRPNVAFVLNHEYRTTSTLDSLIMGVAELDEPFVYLDGDLLVNPEALALIQASSCPTIGVKQTYSDEPLCVDMGAGESVRMAVGFTRELREYEWTGLAKLDPKDVLAARGSRYVYHVVERLLPVNTVEIDCAEVDTRADLGRAEEWMREQFVSSSSGRTAAGA